MFPIFCAIIRNKYLKLSIINTKPFKNEKTFKTQKPQNNKKQQEPTKKHKKQHTSLQKRTTTQHAPPIWILIGIHCRIYRGGSTRIVAENAQGHVGKQAPRDSTYLYYIKGGYSLFRALK
jgi:hypothetical protein